MRVKSWFSRIPLILQHLEKSTQGEFTRSEVSALFKTGRSQATDLMKTAGAEVRQGEEATVSRDALRWYVERCPEAAAFLKDLRRKEELAKQLVQTTEEMRLRAVKLPPLKPEDEWTKWADIANLDVAPGMVRIAVASEEDFCITLQLIAKAMLNQPEEFARLIGEPADPGKAEKFKDPLVVGDHARISRDEFKELLRRATPEEVAAMSMGNATDREAHR